MAVLLYPCNFRKCHAIVSGNRQLYTVFRYIFSGNNFIFKEIRLASVNFGIDCQTILHGLVRKNENFAFFNGFKLQNKNFLGIGKNMTNSVFPKGAFLFESGNMFAQGLQQAFRKPC